jgi:uncharacterized protein (DUF1810 family)
VSGADDLQRFIEAQEHDYERALDELRGGRKRSHWMWYIFPQLDGLGASAMAKRYAIKDRAEAAAYLADPVLGPRLLECVEAVLAFDGASVTDIFGYPDDLKLHSCATLFAAVAPSDSAFDRLLAKYFGGKHDERTVRLLGGAP